MRNRPKTTRQPTFELPSFLQLLTDGDFPGSGPVGLGFSGFGSCGARFRVLGLSAFRFEGFWGFGVLGLSVSGLRAFGL